LFFTQLCHRDVASYLLTIKSLYQAFQVGKVAILNDGSLTTEDFGVLHHHIPGLQVFEFSQVDLGRCPRGGTWERLVKIVELSADTYVIQADADTLVLSDISEVLQCWRDNKPFLLGTDVGQQVQPAPVTARMAQGWIAKAGQGRISVGMKAEAALDTLPDAEKRNYVHASSGFAGFGQRTVNKADLEEFSLLMRERVGSMWDDWGSEQISSNYLLANAPSCVVLPFRRYACYEPPLEAGPQPFADRAFLHFIGSYRYQRGLYRRKAAEVLARLAPP
jgi:hypothetical protein